MKFNSDVLDSLTAHWTFSRLIRVTPLAYAGTPLGMGFGRTRFSSPDNSFKVLYVAPALVTSVAETLIRDRFVDRVRRRLLQEEIETWGATEVATTSALKLLDLREMGPTLLGVPTDALLARNHTAGRKFSREIYRQFSTIDGLLYTSRHVKKDCIMVYERAAYKLVGGPVEPLITLPALSHALSALRVNIISTTLS